RQRIRDLVAHDRAADRLGRQAIEPRDAPASERFLLPGAERAARLEDLIADVPETERRERVEELRRERAVPGAELEDGRILELREHRRERRGNRARERVRELRRGDEIAGRAELLVGGRVIAEARLVQRELHVA